MKLLKVSLFFLIAPVLSSAQSITANGLGATRPVADGRTPEGRAKNRRIEIVVQPAVP